MDSDNFVLLTNEYIKARSLDEMDFKFYKLFIQQRKRKTTRGTRKATDLRIEIHESEIARLREETEEIPWWMFIFYFLFLIDDLANCQLDS